MNIKDFIKKHNITILLIQLSAFGILFLVSKLFFDSVYLFEWTARHNYLYVWIAAALFTFFGKEIIGIFITAGAVLGVPLGEIIGRVIININMTRITEDTGPQEYYYLTSHWGWFVWIVAILAGVVIGIAVTVIKRVRLRGSRSRIGKRNGKVFSTHGEK